MINEHIFIGIVLYAFAAYLHGHQGSHLAYIKAGNAVLNPYLVFILWIYNITFLPWAALIWLGYKTIWYLPFGVLLGSLLIRPMLISIEQRTGLVKHAWAVSLMGIFFIPLCLGGMLYLMVSQI